MRIATKYYMEEVQTAVVRVVRSKSLNQPLGIDEAIGILCFLAEFPGSIEENLVKEVFFQACDTEFHFSIEDLEQLKPYPRLLLAMMKYREGQLSPKTAVWEPRQSILQRPISSTRRCAPTPMEVWLSKELKSLRLMN